MKTSILLVILLVVSIGYNFIPKTEQPQVTEQTEFKPFCYRYDIGSKHAYFVFEFSDKKYELVYHKDYEDKTVIFRLTEHRPNMVKYKVTCPDLCYINQEVSERLHEHNMIGILSRQIKPYIENCEG